MLAGNYVHLYTYSRIAKKHGLISSRRYRITGPMGAHCFFSIDKNSTTSIDFLEVFKTAIPCLANSVLAPPNQTLAPLRYDEDNDRRCGDRTNAIMSTHLR